MFLAAQHRSEIELSLLEPAIAPPLSLSAPELGSDEPFEMPPLRNAVSSSELLHERAMARLYQDAAEEEMHKANALRKSLERRPSLREVALERRHSFKEAASTDRKRDIADETKRHVQIAHDDASARTDSVASKIPVPTRKVDDPPPKSILRKETRLSSEEREQLEFAKVRDRLRLKNEKKQVKDIEPRIRPPNLKQESSMSSQLSSFDGETGSSPYEGEVEDISVEEEEEAIDEEEEEEDYLEEESEMEIEDEIEEEEDDLHQTLNSQKYNAKPSAPEKPPAIPQHGILKKEPQEPEINIREAPKAIEEDTYHPRSMIPTRGVIRALPATVEVEEEPLQDIPKITINEETEQRPDPGSRTIKEVEQKPKEESSIPVAIQTQNSKKSRILKKIGFGLKGKKKAVATLIQDSVPPVTSVVLPKPILKKRSVKKKEKGKGKSQQEESPPPTEGVDQRKKQVRIAEPGEAGLGVPSVDDPKLSPHTQARNQRLQRRQQSLEEEEQANKVLIYHYSDIVREFGGPRKPPPKLYLDLQELEAHAPQIPDPTPEEIIEDVIDDVPDLDETATLISDQEERGSAPDMTAFDTDPGSLSDLSGVGSLEVADPTEEENLVVEERSEGSPPPSPSPPPVRPEDGVRSTLEYLTDVAIFLFACWLYLFKNELYVIPVLVLLVYRQLQDTVRDKYRTVRKSVASKIPKRVLDKIYREGDEANDD